MTHDKQKLALLTGAAGVLGRETARGLAADDYRVIMVAQPLAIIGGVGALWLTGHTLNIYSMIGLVLLVNSASRFPADTIYDVEPEAWQKTLDLTLSSPVFVTQAFADRLPEGLDGAVVNVTDVRTMTPYRKHFSYGVAKGGVDAFTRAAALSLAPGIRVNAVALGVILSRGDGSFEEQLAARLPLARVGGTGPVVDTVLFQ